MFRKATDADLEALVRLFVKTFGGTEDFARRVMQNFAGLENTFVAEENGGIAASLCAVPVTLNGLRGAYYYGVCTDESLRGKGIMTALMEWGKDQLAKEGARFIVLIPASESLFGFYQKRGFEKAFSKRVLTRNIPNNLWAVAEFDTITVKGLDALRKQYKPDSVTFSSGAQVEVLTDLYSGGITTINTEKAYGLYFKKDDRLDFIELFAKTDRDAEYLLEAARQKERAEEARIQLGDCQNLFLGEGAVRDYAMIRYIGEAFDVRDSYLRLALDDE